ncbi:aminomethyltransferase family protein [Kineosporia sp. A_224]|uniref:aminomethyltransferase family protein n=1 Tax=Kineosporia sp. A_224 TaxID=1962180 RepID=UPI000B4B8D93|nr:aminomethyltransferase family protein [Kineosporia sp. A_224]
MAIPENLRPTPFSPRYADTVTEWIDVYGHAVPLILSESGDPGEEYAAIRTTVGFSEYSMLHKWSVEGPDAVAVVDAVFSHNVTTQPVGRIAYGVVTDADGCMVDDVTVSVLSAREVLVVGGNPTTAELLQDATGNGTTVTERRDETAVLTLQGPRSRDVLARLTDADLSNEAFPYYTFRTDLTVAGVPAQVNRVGFTAELGYEIVVPRQHALTLWDAVTDTGADIGARPFGAAALMMCRIEAGMIMGELEYDHTVTPYECRMGWALDFDKGPWLGKNALRAKKGTVRGRVVTVQIDAAPEAAEGARLLLDGTDVGHVTMAVPSPHLGGATLAMARVDQDAAKPGTTLTTVGVDGATTSAIVKATPVYDPERTRVRS